MDTAIPSASSIQAAKEKRDRLRKTKTEGGDSDDFISLSVSKRSDFSQGPHPESRLVREDDELGEAEMGQVLHEHRGELAQLEASFQLGEPRTTRLVEQRVRLGQHRFASQVLKNYEHRCGFCGFAPRGLKGHRLLVASHIKPWALSTDRERLDVKNGITACPTHDAAFDTGLLTVNGGLRIHRAEPLLMSMAADEGTESYFGERILKPHLMVPPKRAPGTEYLRFHQEHVFQGPRLHG